MSITLYQISVPVFIRMLENLSAILDKAVAHCETHGIDPSVLIQFRLYPDMFPFVKQVQLACDHAKNAAARLAGVEAREFSNDEKSFPELSRRVAETVAYLESFGPDSLNGREETEVVIRRGDLVLTYRALDFLLHRALPNFYFHVTTAYDILRHNGVPLGKRDYLGS